MDNSKPVHETTKRLFIGINIPITKDLLNFYNSIQNVLNQSQIKWTNPENFHITLHFLGNTPIHKIGSLNKIISKSIKNNSPFLLELQSIGTFGKNSPRILWVGIKENHTVIDIYNKISAGLNTTESNTNEAIYRPHLTLGRIKHIHSLSILQEMSAKLSTQVIQEYSISEICLFESKLGGKELNYTIIQSFKLV